MRGIDRGGCNLGGVPGMGLYQDDLGNLYWAEQVRRVVPASVTLNGMEIHSHALLIHPHRLPFLSRAGMAVGLSAVLLGLLTLLLRLSVSSPWVGLAGGLAIIVVGVAPFLILRRAADWMQAGGTLRMVPRPPLGLLLLEMTQRLGMLVIVGMFTADLLLKKPDSLWAQVLAGLVTMAALGLGAVALWRLWVLWRPAQTI